MKKRDYAFLLFAVACATQSVKQMAPTPKTVDEVLKPEPVQSKPVEARTVIIAPEPQASIIMPVPAPVEAPKPKVWKTPKYRLLAVGRDMSVYNRAISYIEKYANSDEFYAYLETKATYFAHADCKVKDCIKKFREQLDQGDEIEVAFYTPFWKSAMIGGWDGHRINENTKYEVEDFRRAGHLLHETSHKYGWLHQGNYVKQFDNIHSFPYQVGNHFIDFLETKINTMAVK